MSKGIESDEYDTIKQVRNPNPKENGLTWLRHKLDKECGIIDLLILDGTYTIEKMINVLEMMPQFKTKKRYQWKKRILNHIEHLSTLEGDKFNQISGVQGHDLKVSISKETGIVSFGYK